MNGKNRHGRTGPGREPMERPANEEPRRRDWRRNATPAGIQLVYALDPAAHRAHELAGLCMLALRARKTDGARPRMIRERTGRQQETHGSEQPHPGSRRAGAERPGQEI